MFFQGPWAVVEEGNNPDPARSLARIALGSPSCFEFVSAREQGSPSVSEKVGNEDDECARDGNLCRFELDRDVFSTWHNQWDACKAHSIYLAHDSLEPGENGGQEYAAKRQNGVKVVAQRQQMRGGVGTRNDDDIISLDISFLATRSGG